MNSADFTLMDRAIEFARIAGNIHERYAGMTMSSEQRGRNPAFAHAAWCEQQAKKLMRLATARPKVAK